MAEGMDEPGGVPPGFSQTEDDLMPLPKLRRASVFSQPVFLLVVLVVVGVGVFALVQGVHATPDELIGEGNVLVMQGQPEEALQRFTRCLELDPGNVHAHRGMASAYQVLGDEVRQVEWLDRALGLQGLHRKQESVLRGLICRHYLERALKVRDGDAEVYAAALEKAVGYDPRCTTEGRQADELVEKAWASTASGLLARHLIERTQQAEQEGNLARAADFAHRVGQLLVADRMREQALKTEVALRFKLFKPLFDEEFEAKHKAALIEAGEFDERTRRFLGRAKVKAERPPGVRQNDHTWNTHVKAEAEARGSILDVLAKVAGAPRAGLDTYPEDVAAWTLRAESNAWLNFLVYEMVISMAYDEGAYVAFLIRHRKDLGDGGEAG